MDDDLQRLELELRTVLETYHGATDDERYYFETGFYAGVIAAMRVNDVNDESLIAAARQRMRTAEARLLHEGEAHFEPG